MGSVLHQILNDRIAPNPLTLTQCLRIMGVAFTLSLALRGRAACPMRHERGALPQTDQGKTKVKGIRFLFLALVVALAAMGVSSAHWSDSLAISATVTTGTWDIGGSPGCWKNGGCRNEYDDSEIEDFLDWNAIGSASAWLAGVTTIEDMEAVFDAGTAQHATMEDKFLSQYLATRLNVEADRLYLDTYHYFSDSGNYLGLDGHGTLGQIIAAIEGKHGTADIQFEIMKDICEALNEP